MNTLFLRALLAATVWGIWPLLMSRYAKGPWGMTLLTVTTAVWTALYVLLQKHDTPSKELYSWFAVAMIPILCGAMNSIGLQQYDAIFKSSDFYCYGTHPLCCIHCKCPVLSGVCFAQTVDWTYYSCSRRVPHCQ